VKGIELSKIDTFSFFFNKYKGMKKLKLQSLLTKGCEIKKESDLLDSIKNNKQEQARYLSLRSRLSSRWVNVVPSSSDLMMTDLEFCHAVRNRLSLLPDDRLGDECTLCGKKMSPLHPHICKKLRKLVTGARHDMVTGCVLKRAREAGMTASNEPYLGPGPNPLRADGALFGLLTFLYFDTSVINPSTITSIEKHKSHTKGLLAATGREAVKSKKYKNHLPAGASFVPFVLESFGRFWHWCVQSHPIYCC
jgi:hypothetical protein